MHPFSSERKLQNLLVLPGNESDFRVRGIKEAPTLLPVSTLLAPS